MDLSAVYNNSLDIQSLLTGGTNGINRTNNGYNITDQDGSYAKKGEPMYMADMDTDGDGSVSLDEFRAYCKDKGIGTRDMVNMSKMAAAYRTMKAETEAIDYISKLIPNVFPKLKQADSETGHLRQGENQYNISDDKAVPYKEYIEYCEQNVSPNELRSNTKAEETENGYLKISNSGKSIDAYKSSENQDINSTFEEVV